MKNCECGRVLKEGENYCPCCKQQQNKTTKWNILENFILGGLVFVIVAIFTKGGGDYDGGA